MLAALDQGTQIHNKEMRDEWKLGALHQRGNWIFTEGNNRGVGEVKQACHSLKGERTGMLVSRTRTGWPKAHGMFTIGY